MPPCELAEVGKRPGETNCIGVLVEEDAMQVGGHQDERVHAQVLVQVAEAEALRHSQAGGLQGEDWQPLDNAEGDVVERLAVTNAVVLHGCLLPVGGNAGRPRATAGLPA